MDATLSDKTQEICLLLELLRAKDLVLLEVKEHCDWADFIVIATTNSVTHTRGITTQLKHRLQKLDLPWRNPPQVRPEQEWTLCDAGSLVINLMSAAARQFYQLERNFPDSRRVALRQPDDNLTSCS